MSERLLKTARTNEASVTHEVRELGDTHITADTSVSESSTEAIITDSEPEREGESDTSPLTGDTAETIVKFTQLCSKFPPTALLNFACDWLALDRDISFVRLTSPTRDVISLSRANHHKQSSRELWAGICCKAG